jgi:hypothetical protein
VTTYEAAIRLLTAETPKEKERASRAYLATWTAALPAKRASRKAKRSVPDPLPNNVVSLAKWKAKLGPAHGEAA